MEFCHPHYRGSCSHIWGKVGEQCTLGTHGCPAFVVVECSAEVSVYPDYYKENVSSIAAAAEKS